MLRNYLKIAWRNLMKNKVFSFINIFSLTIGLTCCMLISLYLYHELSYDNYHRNADRIYQIATEFIKEGKSEKMGSTPAPMGKTMQMEFPEIEKSTRILKAFADDKTLLQLREGTGETKSFYETAGFFADSNFFTVLTYRFKEGNPATALTNPNSVVLSEEIAKKMFGNVPALDKVIHISSSTNGDLDFKVTGVFVLSTTPSHIDARFFMSPVGGNVQKMFQRPNDLASNNMFHTYILLKSGTDAKRLEAKFPAFMQKYAANDLKALGFQKKQYLIPITEIHLDAETKSNVTPAGSMTYLYILASIAIFTLIIACVNFMNLSTARSSKRSAEVGVRKVLGAERSSLIKQFIGESILMSLIAFLFAIFFTALLLPLFSKVSGKTIAFSFEHHAFLLVTFLVLAIVTGLFAGIYPAFYLSSFQPVKVLKGRITNSLAAISLRKALVVFQFVISAGLIIAAVIISHQMNYLRSKDLGFEKEQQIVIPLRGEASKKSYAALKSELAAAPQIDKVGASLYYPGIFNPSDMPLYRQGENMTTAKRFFMNWIDVDFLPTLGVKAVAGRVFSKEFIADTGYRMVVNLEGVKQLGFSSPQDAVGKQVFVDWQGQQYKWEIIGVVNDFHFKDLHTPIEPYGLQLNSESNFNYLIAHAKPGSIAAALKSVETAWHRSNPNEPFEYSLLDDDFQKNYEAENRLSAIVRNFTIIAIIISCLGLFGLATFSAEQRTKEIGIRKVLGASVTSIVSLLSKEFLMLVVIAIVIASPLAYLAMNKWLQDFAYRVDIQWWVFVAAAIIAVLIALITISTQAIKAAFSNPVKNLRTE